MSIALNMAEHSWLPDRVIRFGIRQLLRQRLRSELAGGEQATARRQAEYLESLKRSPVAIETDSANEQHYELPAEFFQQVLGPRLKYSSCLWTEDAQRLRDAELAMLQLYGDRAGLSDGQDILEMGCGWGSLTLWMARQFPNSRICAVSNSSTQKRFIEKAALSEGLLNISVVTSDINDFDPGKKFDRVVSVEMFEHLRNYQVILERVAQWLHDDGRLFLHIFCHRELQYPFETEGHSNWMGRYFFTGGQMPAFDTLEQFPDALRVEQKWAVSGKHYEKTSNAWLNNLDQRETHIEQILKPVYGDDTTVWLQRWRMFFMACAELFGFRNGEEWLVGHYRLAKPD